MKLKKYLKIVSIIIIFICIICTIKLLTKVEVTLKDDLTVHFNENKKVSDYILNINGNIIDDYEIDTTKVGKKEVKFSFINEYHIKVKYSYEIEVIDDVSPIIWLGNNYNVKKGSNINLTKKIMCGDNYDPTPKCYIEGDYNLDEIGQYKLTYKAIDSSGNISEQPFTLNVYEPDDNKSNVEKTYTNFSDVIKEYKKENTKIGIDVSSWQGDIDFEKIKNAGVEFIIIRVGRGTVGEYTLDTKFVNNIESANKYGIDVGIYFYSFTNSIKNAKKDAEWVLNQIKDYDVTLPIAFDWEEWSDFNNYKLSFYGLTNVAKTFLDTISSKGYSGMLYSSKTYLEKIWFETKYDTWLAHYTTKTNYAGKYKFWQMCDDGKIDGIDGYVDIDIMY